MRGEVRGDSTPKMGTILPKQGLVFTNYLSFSNIDVLYFRIYIYFTSGKQKIEQEVPKFKIVLVGMYQIVAVYILLVFQS